MSVMVRDSLRQVRAARRVVSQEKLVSWRRRIDVALRYVFAILQPDTIILSE